MRCRHGKRLATAFMALLAVTLSCAAATSWSLPAAAMLAIKANFPGTDITSVGRQHQRGVWFYDVSVKGKGRRFDLEVTAEGVIGSVDGVVRLRDMPGELLPQAQARIGSGRVTRVEKHERRAVSRDGAFVPLKKPRISYGIKYIDEARRPQSMRLASNEILELPDEVRRQLATRWPKAAITDVEPQANQGVMVLAVTLAENEQSFGVDLLTDGRIIEMETGIEAAALPEPALAAVRGDKGLRQTDVPQAYKREAWGAVEKGKVVRRHETTYTVRVRRPDSEREYCFDELGKLLNKPAWEQRRGNDDDDDGDRDGRDDDDDDDQDGRDDDD